MFGRVIRGYEDVIPKIMEVPTDEKDRPKVSIVISNCGELELRKKPVAQQPQQRRHLYFIFMCRFYLRSQRRGYAATSVDLQLKLRTGQVNSLVVEADDHRVPYFLLHSHFLPDSDSV